MILYVNGDSHSAGAQAVNDFCFAEDDPMYYSLGRIPHPDNERVSYGCIIANELNAVLHCDAESASSNTRIIRTTREYLKSNKPDIIILGWSTWEREEWLHQGVYWQVNCGGTGHDWPDEIKERYKQYVINIDWAEREYRAHNEIFDFHLELQEQQLPHLFFSCFNDFRNQIDKKDWNNCYIDPYDPNMTYYNWLSNNGFKSNEWYHYRADAHRKWAEFLLPHLTKLL